jgi:hypothetical protein
MSNGSIATSQSAGNESQAESGSATHAWVKSQVAPDRKLYNEIFAIGK